MADLKYSQIKTIYRFAEDCGISYWKDIVENICNEEEDFEVERYRFIHEDAIDKIQQEELESDPYILGCFNADFIAHNTDLSYDIVKALQEADKFEALGQHIIDNDYVADMQSEYARLDGYGHHFAHYDGETLEDLLEFGYYVFKVN